MHSKMIQKSLILTSNINRLPQNIIVGSVRKMSTDENDIIIQDINDKGILTLNRPKALNALNLSMVRKMYPKLKEWEQTKSLVIVKGAGEKAFCAGGDVRAVVEAGLKGNNLGVEFFREEYRMNGVIGTYKIPYIAIIPGIVMGGGVGLSVHGRYRIATESTLFAMPETQIGLFPDVGGSYFLPRLGGRLGTYLALTGVRLKGSDVLKAGIATHYVDAAILPKLEEELLKNCSNDLDIQRILKKYHIVDNKEFSLAKDMDKINYVFSSDTVEGIVKKLERDNSDWAKKTLETLKKMSPTSLKVTLNELELGSKMDLQQCLQMEYRMAVNCLDNKDFYEGVKALLIEKTGSPKWTPPSLHQVTKDTVDSYFVRLPEDQELKHKL